MAIRPVLRLGDPRLLQVASEVTDFNSAELDMLIEDMFDTMAAQDGAGLAAPQIGIGLRVVIFGFDDNPRYPDISAVPRTILINPQIIKISDEMEQGWEGCLSVPGMRGVVSRYKHIRYSGFDAAGNAIDVDASGFHARVVQHECDHLDGIIYTQRLTEPSKFGFTEELLSSGQLSSDGCSE
ncbi:MAG: peptide deformylase [Gammaproteobacteria bacterium]|nr:peptide deformylase [Gammaproteobacteria bacterium]NNJ49980.1 peptide deformylase [Gammaproteobacteria bacterium]